MSKAIVIDIKTLDRMLTQLKTLISDVNRMKQSLMSKDVQSVDQTKDEPEVFLSARAEKRYAKMFQDMRVGRNVHTAENVDDLIRQLNAK